MRLLVGLIIYLLVVSNAYADAFKIGWIGPLTGNSAVLGIDSLQAAKLVVDNANRNLNAKNQFELLIEDDQYDTSKTVSAYTKLVSQGVKFILASTYGGIFAIAERAQKDGVIVINPLDCNEDIAKLPENIFCIATLSESVGSAIAEDLRSKDIISAAVIFDEKNPFMSLVANTIKNYQGIKISDLIAVDQASTDFRAETLRIRANKAESIIFLGHDPMGNAMRQARLLGIKGQFYTVGTITSPGFQSLAGEAANGALVAYWEAPSSSALSDFLYDFEKKVGRQPILQLATIPTYDAANILISAINSSEKFDIVSIKRSLLGLKDYQGLSGKITIDHDGAARSIKEVIYRFANGELKRE